MLALSVPFDKGSFFLFLKRKNMFSERIHLSQFCFIYSSLLHYRLRPQQQSAGLVAWTFYPQVLFFCSQRMSTIWRWRRRCNMSNSKENFFSYKKTKNRVEGIANLACKSRKKNLLIKLISCELNLMSDLHLVILKFTRRESKSL